MPFTPRIAEDAIGDFDGFRIWDRNPGTGDVRLDIGLDAEGQREWAAYEEAWAEHDRPKGMIAALTDTHTGSRIYVKRADCGAGCFCAAEITEVASNPIAEAREAERQAKRKVAA